MEVLKKIKPTDRPTNRHTDLPTNEDRGDHREVKLPNNFLPHSSHFPFLTDKLTAGHLLKLPMITCAKFPFPTFIPAIITEETPK